MAATPKMKQQLLEDIKKLGKDWKDIKPLHDRLLIRRIMDGEITSKLIILPDIAKSKPHRGVVLATGPGQWIEGINGNQVRRPCVVKPGDIVAFGKWNDCEELDYADLLLIMEGDIWYIEGLVDRG